MAKDDIDQTGKCNACGGDIEHYAGIPGSEFMTPFWRHLGILKGRAHPATPRPGTEREA